MDKKKIVISISLIVFMLVVIIIYNLVIKKKNENNNTNTIDQNIVNEPTNKSVIDRITGTTLCKNIYNNSEIFFTTRNDKITRYKLTASKNIGSFGYDDTYSLTDEDKRSIENEILKELNLDSFEYKGITLSVEYKDEVFLIIDVDYSNCDLSVIEKLKIKFNDTYSNTIKNLLSTKEYKCE